MTASESEDRIWTRYLTIAVVFCVLLATALLVYIKNLNETIEQETKTYLAECGDQAAHNLRDDLRLLLNSAAMMADFVGRSDEQLFDHKFLLTLASRSRSAYFSYIGEADRNGLMHTIDGRVLYVGDRSYFQQAMNGRANISPLLTQKTSGEKSIVFAAPITRGREIIGVLCAPLAPKDFVSIFRITVFNGDGRSYITDDHGEVIMAQTGFEAKENIGGELDAAGDNILRAMLTAMADGKNGVHKFFAGGAARYVGYTSIGYNHWYLLMTIPDKVVNRRFAGFTRVTLFCGAFLFVFFALLALLTSKIFIAKSKKLSETMKDLQASEARYKIVTENTEEHIFEWNMKSDAIYCSPSFEEHFGVPGSKHNVTMADVLMSGKIDADDLLRLRAFSEEFRQGRTRGDMELKLQTPDGSYHWCRLKAVSTSAGGSTCIVGVLTDVDAEHRERERLLYQAQSDKLTGLYDKLTTQELIGSFLSADGSGGRHSMILLDIDDFKSLNDKYGHFFGDQALQAAAAKMKETFRTGDIIGRVGGDEFMVLLKNTSDTDFVKRKSYELAEALRHSMDGTIHANCISVSFGISFYPASGRDFATLYKAADSALYQAKNAGKNSFALYRTDREAEVFKCDERERSLSLLVVCSQAEGRAALRRAMETEYNIVEADGHEGAMKLLREVRDIGAVLADLSDRSADKLLPTLDLVRNDRTVVDIPMLIIVSAGCDAMRAAALEAGVDELIVRPCDADTLRARVRGVIARSVISHMEKEKQLYKDLSSSNSRLQSIVDTVPCGIAMIKLKADGSIEPSFFSDAFCQLSGSPRDFIDSCDLFSFVLPEDMHLLKEQVRCVLEDGRARVDCRFRIIDQLKRVRWLSMSGEQFHEENGEHMFSLIFLDTTDEVTKAQQEQQRARELLYKSRHDQLTGIYNRETFFAETEKMLAADPDGRYVMVCCDADRFSVVNDLFGNKIGDQVLAEIPNIFIPIAKSNWRYGRIGGDIFAACLPYGVLDTDLLENSARYRCPALGGKYELILRFGIYIISGSSISVDAMCDRAIMALRTIKDSYSNHYAFYNNAIRDRMLSEQEITSDMETALSEGEFEIWFQPIYDMATERPAMAEALVRWKRPDKGIIMPGSFIPLFERNGFISKLDAFVWEEVCRKLADMRRLGLEPLPVSVNISRLDFYSGGVCSCLSALTEKYGAAPQSLRLEITESTYSRDPYTIGQAIADLHKRGFTLMVDDFGSGWSTLETIKDAPVDMMKIDKRLVDDIGSSARARIVLDSVIQMAQTIGMTVIAEGVEATEQADVLRRMKCDLVQGFLYSKPLPWDEFVKLLSRNS